MSQSRSRGRLIRAGLIVGAVGAALLVAPQAAFAGSNVGPMVVPPGGQVTVFDPSAPFSASTSTVQVTASAGGCPNKSVALPASGVWGITPSNRTTSQVAFTLPTANGPTATNANGVVKLYYACVYDSSNTTTNNIQGGGPFYVGAPVGTSVNGGLTGGGNPITLNSGAGLPVFTGYSTVTAVFNTGSCNPTLGSSNPANLTVAGIKPLANSTVSLTVPSGAVTGANGGGPTMYNVCLYDGSSATGSLLSVMPYNVNIAGVSPASGSYLNSTGVTVSSPLPFLSGITTPAVLLAPNMGCPGIYPTSTAGMVVISGVGTVRRLSNYRAAVVLPPLQLMPPGQPTNYSVCLYSSTNTSTGNLVGTTNYTASIVAYPTAVLPAAGPAAGGNTITVVGTDFPTDPGRITATLGGLPLTNIQPVSPQAFTAQVPAHAVENNVPLVVTTSAGTKALLGAYSFLNPIKVSPNTAPSTAPSVDVDVQGSGFFGINFGTGGSAGRVFLVDGVYNGASPDGTARANGPLAECVNVLPVADDELICTLQLNRRLTSTGAFFNSVAYNNPLGADVTTTAGSKVITSVGGKFTPNDVGQPISQTSHANIPDGSIITAVLSPTKAVISMTSPASVVGATATIGGAAAHTILNALSTTAGSTTVSLTNGSFTSADVGRVFSGTPGIPDFTTILSVAPGGGSATISAAATLTTMGTLAGVTAGDGSTTINSSSIASGDQYGVVGPNALGIPVGAVLNSVIANTSATLSQPASGGGSGTIALNRVVTASLYAAAPVPDGSYNLVVVSNGQPGAADTDPSYFQTDVTSSSTFTVAPF